MQPWRTEWSLHYTANFALNAQELRGELTAPLYVDGIQPPKVDGPHYGFHRVLYLSANKQKKNLILRLKSAWLLLS